MPITPTYSGDVDAIAAIVSSILAPFNGVAYDSTSLPPQLTVFPCAMTIVGPGDWLKFGSDEYVVRTYVAPVANGNPAVAYLLCLQTIQAYQDVFSQLSSINNRPLMRQSHGHAKSPRGLGTSGFYYTQKYNSQEAFGHETYLSLGPRSP